MNRLKIGTILGILLVIIAGTLFHFVFEWSGNNPLVGLFFPVNESTWEHMKLSFFPMLLYSFFMNQKLKEEYPCITPSLLIGTLLATFLIPVLFYTYTGILEGNFFVLDIATYILSIVIAFLAVYKLTLTCNTYFSVSFLILMVIIIAVCFLVFTYFPPKLGLFADPIFLSFVA